MITGNLPAMVAISIASRPRKRIKRFLGLIPYGLEEVPDEPQNVAKNESAAAIAQAMTDPLRQQNKKEQESEKLYQQLLSLMSSPEDWQYKTPYWYHPSGIVISTGSNYVQVAGPYEVSFNFFTTEQNKDLSLAIAKIGALKTLELAGQYEKSKKP